jgi:hypothetical protein
MDIDRTMLLALHSIGKSPNSSSQDDIYPDAVAKSRMQYHPDSGAAVRLYDEAWTGIKAQ